MRKAFARAREHSAAKRTQAYARGLRTEESKAGQMRQSAGDLLLRQVEQLLQLQQQQQLPLKVLLFFSGLCAVCVGQCINAYGGKPGQAPLTSTFALAPHSNRFGTHLPATCCGNSFSYSYSSSSSCSCMQQERAKLICCCFSVNCQTTTRPDRIRS